MTGTVEFQQIKTQLIQEIKEGDLLEALTLMFRHIRGDAPSRERLQQLTQRFDQLRLQQLQGRITTVSAHQMQNELVGDVLEWMDTIESGHFQPIGDASLGSAQCYDNPLLVVAHNSHSIKQLEEIFYLLRFREVEVRNLQAASPDSGIYDLVVFDNTDLEPCPDRGLLDTQKLSDPQVISDRTRLMERFFEETDFFMLHYGPTNFLTQEQPDRLRGAANRIELFRELHLLRSLVETLKV